MNAPFAPALLPPATGEYAMPWNYPDYPPFKIDGNTALSQSGDAIAAGL